MTTTKMMENLNKNRLPLMERGRWSIVYAFGLVIRAIIIEAVHEWLWLLGE